MKTDKQIQYWAHMLDESKHASYYEVFMQEHPEDELLKLASSLIAEFAESLKKDRINVEDCVAADGKADFRAIEKMQQKIKHKYIWEKIPA